MRRVAALALLAFAFASVAAGCGGGGDDGGSETTTTTTAATETTATETTSTGTQPAVGGEGAAVFASAGCGTCHVFAAAGSTGTTGPSLDSSELTVDQIEGQVRYPSGPMPSFADQLSDAQIAAVAKYVAENRAG